MMEERLWDELNNEVRSLIKEYAKLKNKPRLFETQNEKETREIQLEKDGYEKHKEFDSLGDNFEKKRDYVLNLKKEVEALKSKERKDELEQKLKDQNITEKELLELQALNNIL